MDEKYQIPLLRESPYLYVGIVKKYDKDRRFGYIGVLYKRDIFFHVNNIKCLEPVQNTIVSFRVRKSPLTGKLEGYDVSCISYHIKELLVHQENLLVGDLNIIYYVQPEIFAEELSLRLKSEYDFLKNINSYIEKCNIHDIVDSYKIEVAVRHIHKPGDDDVVSVDYIGDRNKCVYLIASKSIRDTYLDTILPSYSQNIFHDRGFYPWREMLDSFGDLTTYRREAIRKTEYIKELAVKSYNKQEHKDSIEKLLKECINYGSIRFREDLEKDVSESLSYGYKLDCKLEDIRS